MRSNISTKNTGGIGDSSQTELDFGQSIKYVRKIFLKTNISNSHIRTRTCVYQGVRNVSFSENFA